MNKEYYIYCYYDKDWVPFYIGMGHGERVFGHVKKCKHIEKKHAFFYNKLEKIIDSGEDYHYEILRDGVVIDWRFFHDK